jgi:hypothetical protein
MPKSGLRRKERYLYAVISGSGDRIFAFPGIDEMPVYAISDGKVSAVVSDASNAKIRPERRHLAAHHEVLKRLMKDTTPLPMAFGIIANGTRAIRNILSRNREALLEQLNRVQGKVEMGLRVAWDVPNIFEYFVNTHPELRAARDRLFGPQRRPTQEDKIELGTMFDQILNEERENHTGKIEEVIAPHCYEIRRNKCRNEPEITNLACLVGRETQAQFEASIFEAARLFDNNFAFDYNGPWAPHNFVEIDLKL